MTISGVESTTANKPYTTNAKPGELGRDDFLNLLVTQLQHQDPLNPMDSTDFTAQLAQFSSLEQLSNMSSQLGELTQSQTALTNSQAVGYIGHRVLCTGSDVAFDGTTPTSLAIHLSQPAHNVFLSIYDATGGFVASLETGALAAGRQSAIWDGLDVNGNKLPGGTYYFETVAVDASGMEIQAQPMSSGQVDGVVFKDGLAWLKLGHREVALADVVEVIRPADPVEAD